MKIKINKLNPDLKMPVRAHYNDAGIDCFSLEDYTLQPISRYGLQIGEDGQEKLIPPTPSLIPLGFSLEIPDGMMVTIRPRSSMNLKGIITQIGTIDSGYHGEIKCVLINTTLTPYTIHKGDKICQLVVEPVILTDLVESLDDSRGEGGFGSSGR